MRSIQVITTAGFFVFLIACSSPQADAAEAQKMRLKHKKKSRNRLDLIEKYLTCVEDAAGDNEKTNACESYLKAAEALK
jgi:hypothetical protein